MATIPSTIVVFTEDKINFPLKWALVVMKQLFQYGVNRISVREEKIFIELSYTPNAQKLKSKFGTLPIRYMRVKIENPKEFKILEKVVKTYRFNLLDEDVATTSDGRIEMGVKKQLIAPLSPPAPAFASFSFEEAEEMCLLPAAEEEEQQERVIKRPRLTAAAEEQVVSKNRK